MKTTQAKAVAVGGVFAAMAVVIQGLGGLVPVATFVLPVLCMFLECVVLRIGGKRLTWAWFGAVAILGLLVCPDKESAMLFLLLGYYPIIKPSLDRLPLSWLWKLLLFQCVVAVAYLMLIYLLGMEQLIQEYMGLGLWFFGAMLLMGNVTFLLLDKALDRFLKISRTGKTRKF